MADEPRSAAAADPLEARLAALGSAIDWPASPDLAATVGGRLRDRRAGPARVAWLRPARRALLAAAVLLLLLAAAVAALSFLVPGVRIVPLPAGASLPPVASPSAASDASDAPLGAALGLGTPVDLEDAETVGGFEPLLPDAPGLAPPDEVAVAVRRINLLWRASEALPETEADGVGLVVTQFRGLVDDGWYDKLVFEGSTRVEEITVGGQPAWWVTGDPHQLVYRDAEGRALEETRRVVGDVLIWRHDGITLRIESALGRDATIRLAETFGER